MDVHLIRVFSQQKLLKLHLKNTPPKRRGLNHNFWLHLTKRVLHQKLKVNDAVDETHLNDQTDKQVCVCASTRAPRLSSVPHGWERASLVCRRSLYKAGELRQVRQQRSRLFPASVVQTLSVLQTGIKNHNRYFSDILLALLSEYLQAEHAIHLTTCLI